MTTPCPPADTGHAAILVAPFGVLGVRLAGERLTGLDFLPPGHPPRAPLTPVATRLAEELKAYWADPDHAFDPDLLPEPPAGTAFRRRVWALLRTIPPGRTRTYGDLARELGSAPRAVGQAVGDNPLPIVIPCHRVIAADGGLGGFAHARTGYSLDIKRWLLIHEGAWRENRL